MRTLGTTTFCDVDIATMSVNGGSVFINYYAEVWAEPRGIQ